MAIKGTTIYPPKRLKDKLKIICKRENRSMNNLIILILEKHVDGDGK